MFYCTSVFDHPFKLIQAGIASEALTIALEPEGASLFCRHLPIDSHEEGCEVSLASFAVGDKYLVLDAGGSQIFLISAKKYFNCDTILCNSFLNSTLFVVFPRSRLLQAESWTFT